jgi:UDP:flavonoid glycosyltransferase YjiC (YdhE family)
MHRKAYILWIQSLIAGYFHEWPPVYITVAPVRRPPRCAPEYRRSLDRGVDQSFWAERITQLGVGERCTSIAWLDAKKMAAALTSAITDPVRSQRAAELGEKIRAEDGVGLAVQLINQVLRQ